MQTELKTLARKLRQETTRNERALWKCLRNRKLAGLKFRRQQPFGNYVLDFYCAEKKLAVELDGGQHDAVGHRERDQQRTAFLESNGIRTVRFWNSQVRENLTNVLSKIKKAAGLSEAAPSPRPSPPRGEGEDAFDPR